MGYEAKTQPTTEDAHAFIGRIENESKREDSATLLRLMQTASGSAPVMWGEAIVGFGRARIDYADGSQGESLLIGFAPRQREFALYLDCGLEDAAAALRGKGKFKEGKGCLYLKRLADVQLPALEKALDAAVRSQAERRLPD
ncbi:DUF1801 domain-containing protein [Rivibacter subsaxonicus]|uniref:YdhG-like domain-containing protein n=1 Tax=Rivibacter subsaxonicus TaxID=457575 RepID=A0A4Q7VWM7_9BURK|nr:DUF1801 domain-containing protein [Rivibacter subsaxonicus]RZU01137.1 hypothetical protein EV670_1852 [Rivibacter subsaxonicus]